MNQQKLIDRLRRQYIPQTEARTANMGVFRYWGRTLKHQLQFAFSLGFGTTLLIWLWLLSSTFKTILGFSYRKKIWVSEKLIKDSDDCWADLKKKEAEADKKKRIKRI